MSGNHERAAVPDRVPRGSMGLCHLTVFQPPFGVDARALPAQDPRAAREFVESTADVVEVLEELGPRSVLDPLPCDVRADLDIVHAAAWGGMLGIANPAFAGAGDDTPLLAEAERQRERFPDARIVGRVTFYGGAEHTEDLVLMPNGAMFHASGRPGEDPFVVTGDPHAVIASLGLPGWVLDNAGVDLREPANEIGWAALAGLALGRSDPWGWEQLRSTAFRVRHSESAVRSLENLYFM